MPQAHDRAKPGTCDEVKTRDSRCRIQPTGAWIPGHDAWFQPAGITHALLAALRTRKRRTRLGSASTISTS